MTAALLTVVNQNAIHIDIDSFEAFDQIALQFHEQVVAGRWLSTKSVRENGVLVVFQHYHQNDTAAA
jgi:hypothetical protein